MNINVNPSMTNFKIRRQKFGISSLLFLLLFGAVFAGVGVSVLKSNRVDPNWTRVTGEIVEASSRTSDGSTLYSPVVEYEVSGQSHRVAGKVSTSSYPPIGEKREVAYNPSRPDQSKLIESIGSTWWLYVFPLVGIICLTIAPYQFIRSAKRSSNIKRLMQNGQKLQGVIVGMQSKGRNNNTSTYTIVVSATNLSGSVQNFASDTITGIGGLAVADFRNNPIPIDVYVDPTDPQNYYVDIVDIPNLTGERIGDLIKSAVQDKQSSTFATGENPPTPPTPPTDPTLPPSHT